MTLGAFIDAQTAGGMQVAQAGISERECHPDSGATGMSGSSVCVTGLMMMRRNSQ
jgi:hypothetical protein